MVERARKPQVGGDGFGPALRRERERRGLTLDLVARETKIGVPVLAGLERDDFSLWPPGIFRRAFLRAYADAIGLDPESVVAEFSRCFDDKEPDAPPKRLPVAAVHLPADSAALRLSLAAGNRQVLPPSGSADFARRTAALTLDLAVGAAAGAIIAWATHATAPWLSMLAVFAVWVAAGTLATGTSPGVWLVRRRTRLEAAAIEERAQSRAADPREPLPAGEVAPADDPDRAALFLHRVRS